MHRSLCLHNSPMHGGSVALRTSGERWHWPMQTLPPCCQGLTVYSALTCVPPCQNDLSVHWHLACHHGCEGHSPLLCSQEVLRKPHSAGEVGHLGVPLGHLGRMRPHARLQIPPRHLSLVRPPEQDAIICQNAYDTLTASHCQVSTALLESTHHCEPILSLMVTVTLQQWSKLRLACRCTSANPAWFLFSLGAHPPVLCQRYASTCALIAVRSDLAWAWACKLTRQLCPVPLWEALQPSAHAEAPGQTHPAAPCPDKPPAVQHTFSSAHCILSDL